MRAYFGHFVFKNVNINRASFFVRLLTKNYFTSKRGRSLAYVCVIPNTNLVCIRKYHLSVVIISSTCPPTYPLAYYFPRTFVIRRSDEYYLLTTAVSPGGSGGVRRPIFQVSHLLQHNAPSPGGTCTASTPPSRALVQCA